MSVLSSYGAPASDPFAFFYLPETDPTRVHTPEAEGAEVERSLREVMTEAPAWADAVHRSKYRPGAWERWQNCPSYEVMRGVSMAPHASYHAAPEDAAQLREAYRAAMPGMTRYWEDLSREVVEGGPRRDGELRVVRRKRTLGYIPRPTSEPVGSARAFHATELLPDVSDVHPAADQAVLSRSFVLLYEMWTPDGGWTSELVLDAGDVSIDLIERIPGWRSSSI